MIVIDHVEYGKLYLDIWRSQEPATTLEMKIAHSYKLRSAAWFTFATLYVANKHVHLIGAAGCHPADTYDALAGINLALKRLGGIGDERISLLELECLGLNEARWIERMWRLILYLASQKDRAELMGKMYDTGGRMNKRIETRLSELLTAYSGCTDEQIAEAADTKNGRFLVSMLRSRSK